MCLLKCLVFEKECSELFFKRSYFKIKQKQKTKKKIMKKNSEYKINPWNAENIYVMESIDIYPLKRLSELILPK